MITLRVEVPYASFRKSYARSFAETYPLPPPATVYGMLLSLVGERFRRRHKSVRLAFAYRCYQGERKACGRPCLPDVATTLRKLSRYKYGVPGKQSKLGNAPDFIETLCGIEFICWVDSSKENTNEAGSTTGDGSKLEDRIVGALHSPASVSRYGVLCLGLSDDAINDVSLCEKPDGEWHRLIRSEAGTIELPVRVDHIGAAKTRWQRYELEPKALIVSQPAEDQWTEMLPTV